MGHARLAPAMPIRIGMNGAEGLTGTCKACGTTLARAVMREVRHYEETRLLEVTCGGCERQFLAIQVQAVAIDALKVEDVVEAAEQLTWARSLSDLFAPGDLDRPDAA
jgi:ribosomal protein S27E